MYFFLSWEQTGRMVTLQWVQLKQNTLLMLSYTPRVLAPTVDQMLLPSEQMGVTSHIGKQVPQLAHAIPPEIPFRATILPLVVGDLPGGFRISWPYYLEIGCRIVWLYHTDHTYHTYCVAISYGSTFEFKPSFRSCPVRSLPLAMD